MKKTSAIVHVCHGLLVHRAHVPGQEWIIRNAHQWLNWTSQFLFGARIHRWPVNYSRNIWSWWCESKTTDTTLLKNRDIFSCWKVYAVVNRDVSASPQQSNQEAKRLITASSVPLLIRSFQKWLRQGYAYRNAEGKTRIWYTAQLNEPQNLRWTFLLWKNVSKSPVFYKGDGWDKDGGGDDDNDGDDDGFPLPTMLS